MCVDREDAGVGHALHDQCGHCYAVEVRHCAALRVFETPHGQPCADRRRDADAVRAVIEELRWPEVADSDLAVVGLKTGIQVAGVGPRAVHVEHPVDRAGCLEALQFFERPGGDAVVPGYLGRSVALDELRRIRRTVLGAVHVERRIDGRRIGLVGDRWIEPVGEHLGPTHVGIRRHIEVRRYQFVCCIWYVHTEQRLQARLSCLRLVGGHQRAPAGVPEKYHVFDSRYLAQPTHTDSDVDQCVLQAEVRLDSAETCIPAEKAISPGRHEFGHVVLGEVYVVVRGDECGTRPAAGGRVVQPLGGHVAGPVAGCRW